MTTVGMLDQASVDDYRKLRWREKIDHNLPVLVDQKFHRIEIQIPNIHTNINFRYKTKHSVFKAGLTFEDKAWLVENVGLGVCTNGWARGQGQWRYVSCRLIRKRTECILTMDFRDEADMLLFKLRY